MFRRLLGLGAAALVAVMTPVASQATIVQIDFGASDVPAYEGTQSAGHALGLVPDEADQWVRSPHVPGGTGGATGSISMDAFGNALTGFEAMQGRTDNDLDEGEIGSGWWAPGTGTNDDEGIYDTVLMSNDFRWGSSTNRGGPAYRVRGFEAGTYEVITMHRLAGSSNDSEVHIGVNMNNIFEEGVQVREISISGELPETWVEGANYVRATVEVSGPDDWIVVHTWQDPATGNSGRIHGMQIIPEPGSLGLIAVGATVLFLRRGREQV